MNLFNRILIIVLDLALIVAAVAVLLVTLGLLQPGDLAPTAWFNDRLKTFPDLDRGAQTATATICTALLFGGLLLLWWELKPASAAGRRFTPQEDSPGRVTVARDTVEELVNREATQIAGVTESRARVEDEDGRIRIRERIAIDPSASVPELTQEVRSRVKAAVERHLGRSVEQVAVEAQVQLLDGDRSRQRVR